MRVRLFAVPYDSGYLRQRLGLGPEYLLAHGAGELIRALGHELVAETIYTDLTFCTEITTTFDLCRRLAARVKDAHTLGQVPLVLSGNCFAAVGTVSGIGAAGTGVIWFDAHGEYNTPETTVTGFLDGMGLAALTGECWEMLASSVPGFHPIDPNRILHIGGYEFDASELERLQRARVHLVTLRDCCTGTIEGAIVRLQRCVERVYLHLDLDVLDLGSPPASPFETTGGLQVNQVVDAIRAIRERASIAAVGLAGVAPALDVKDRVRQAALALIGAAFST